VKITGEMCLNIEIYKHNLGHGHDFVPRLMSYLWNQ
jgi:hypothetical protein